MFESLFTYKYVSVSFAPNSGVYYYRTSLTFIKAGDVVIVPTNNGKSLALVLGVQKYSGNHAPYPVNKTKKVIEKADPSLKKEFLAEYNGIKRSIPSKRRKRKELVNSYYVEVDSFFHGKYYQCGSCNAVFKVVPPACPRCHAVLKKREYDPRYIDELDAFEEEEEYYEQLGY